MEIPMTITVYLKINGCLYSDSIYSEAKRSFVLKDGAAPLIDIRQVAENLKSEIKQITGAETIEFITQEEYDENGD